jgi:hypothetical protein
MFKTEETALNTASSEDDEKERLFVSERLYGICKRGANRL